MFAERKRKLEAATKRKKLNTSVINSWQLYLMLLIPIVYLIVFKYVPMFGVTLAFKDYTFSGGIWGSPWVGLSNFKKFFSSYQFGRVLWNTVRLSLYSIVAGFPLPIILALILNATQRKLLKKTVQLVTYLPHFISMVVMVGILSSMFNVRIGLYGTICKLLGVNAYDVLGSADAFPHFYVWTGVWQEMGWGTIVFLAALSAVDVSQHEAAIVDGASRFRRILCIDLPSISTTIIILLIMRCGEVMNIGFEKAFLLQNSINLSSSEIISTYVYKTGLVTGGGDFSYATAIGLFNSVINFGILLLVNFVSGKVAEVNLF